MPSWGWHALFMLVALGICLCFLFFKPGQNGNDLKGHHDYLAHIKQNPWDPFGYTSLESWHPPTYYYFGALFDSVVAPLHVKGLSGRRLLSIALYLIYIHFGLRTLRMFLSGSSLIIASILLVVWPSNAELATRFNSDSAVFPIYAAAQFYVARGFLKGCGSDYCRAIAVSLLGLALKTSALAPLFLALVGVSCGLLAGRVRIPADARQRTRWELAIVACLLIGATINGSRWLYYQAYDIQLPIKHIGGRGPDPLPLREISAFNPLSLLASPLSVGAPRSNSALEFAFKTALFTEHPSLGTYRVALGRAWVALVLAQLLMLIVLVAQKCASAIRSLKASQAAAEPLARSARNLAARLAPPDAWPLLIMLAVPVASLVAFTWVKQWFVCANYRFVQPSIVAWIILLVLPLEPSGLTAAASPRVQRFARLGCYALLYWALVSMIFKIFLLNRGWT